MLRNPVRYATLRRNGHSGVHTEFFTGRNGSNKMYFIILMTMAWLELQRSI